MEKAETIVDVFKWIDDSLILWRTICSTKEFDERLFQSRPIEGFSDCTPNYVSEYQKYIRLLEQICSVSTEYNIHFIFKRIFRLSNLFLENKPAEIPLPLDWEANTQEGLIGVLYWDLDNFYAHVHQLCKECQMDITQFSKYDLPDPAWVRVPSKKEPAILTKEDLGGIF